jgi:fibronectin-binding autotransporter adhesin
LNYAGRFDALIADGQDAHSLAHVHSLPHSSTPADAIVVPDAHLLFHGDFKRSGVDLILSGDEREIVLHDYFKGDKRAALALSSTRSRAALRSARPTAMRARAG